MKFTSFALATLASIASTSAVKVVVQVISNEISFKKFISVRVVGQNLFQGELATTFELDKGVVSLGGDGTSALCIKNGMLSFCQVGEVGFKFICDGGGLVKNLSPFVCDFGSGHIVMVTGPQKQAVGVPRCFPAKLLIKPALLPKPISVPAASPSAVNVVVLFKSYDENTGAHDTKFKKFMSAKSPGEDLFQDELATPFKMDKGVIFFGKGDETSPLCNKSGVLSFCSARDKGFKFHSEHTIVTNIDTFVCKHGSGHVVKVTFPLENIKSIPGCFPTHMIVKILTPKPS